MLSIKNISKKFNGKDIIENLNIDLKSGEFVTILGPNGCGKTTLLKAIANIIDYKGQIKKQTKNIGYVGQNPEQMLLPWMNVRSNMIFPNKDVNENILNELLIITKLKDLENHYPYQLSGGMEHLFLIGRSILNNSGLILLDEPFKSLDFIMVEKMRKRFLEMHEMYKHTVLMVSHDITEAILMSDKIIVLSDKPTKIKKVIKNNLEKEDKFSNNTSKKFVRLKEEILNAFK